MARNLRDTKLDSKAARRVLKPRAKPFWCCIEHRRLHLGYRPTKKARGGAALSGTWLARHYLGGDTYRLEKIGIADDWGDADGLTILNYMQAVEAARARMVFRAENAAGPGKRPWTVRDAMDDYLAYLESEKKSAQDARYKAEAFILPKFGEREIASLTVDELRAWLNDLAKAPARIRTARKGKRAKAQQHKGFDAADEEMKRRRRATANRILTYFRAALNRAWKDKKVSDDSAWRRLGGGFKSVDAARPGSLTIDEATRLMNGCRKDFRQLVQAALVTGCRYGELTRLTVADFDPRKSRVTIRISKSGKSRDVFLTDEGAAFFARLADGRLRSEILLRKDNGQPWRAAQQIRPMREACQRANIEPPIGFHGLRHTWATLSLEGDVPILVVAQNLGHGDTRMVEKHYGHIKQKFAQEQIRKGAPTFGIKIDSKVVSIRAAKQVRR